jgi:simple sugar transport system permease protein
MKLSFIKNPRLDRLYNLLMPFIAAVAALAVGAVMLLILGVNPVVAYSALLEGAFGSKNALADTLVKATPLLLVGTGICIAFRGGVINIGGEGQLVVGAVASTLVGLSFPDASGWLLSRWHCRRFVAGAIWEHPGIVKHFNVTDLSTIDEPDCRARDEFLTAAQ